MADRLLIDPERMLPVSEANAKGVSKLVSEAEAGNETLLLRGGKPTAFVVGYERYRNLVESESHRQNTLLALQAILRKLNVGTHPPVPIEDVFTVHSFDPKGSTDS
jgi:antitoxin (DNA-binding transcriptional repressor) of toxin-antitoxin stability system